VASDRREAVGVPRALRASRRTCSTRDAQRHGGAAPRVLRRNASRHSLHVLTDACERERASGPTSSSLPPWTAGECLAWRVRGSRFRVKAGATDGCQLELEASLCTTSGNTHSPPREDAAPPADQAITPSWRSLARPSAKHRFTLVNRTVCPHLRLPPLEVPLPAGQDRSAFTRLRQSGIPTQRGPALRAPTTPTERIMAI
jgi:hypothetical protein